MRIDYEIFQGDTLNIDIQPTDDLDAPFDLSGYVAEVAIEYIDAAGARQTWSAISPGSIDISVDGIISCAVPASATAAFQSSRKTTWQMRLTDPLGQKMTLAEGDVLVRDTSFF